MKRINYERLAKGLTYKDFKPYARRILRPSTSGEIAMFLSLWAFQPKLLGQLKAWQTRRRKKEKQRWASTAKITKSSKRC